MNSQRNESLNGTIASKNLKIRHYGGSEGSNFCTACGVAQHNEGHKFVNKALFKAGITEGTFCLNHQHQEDLKSINDKIRKKSVAYKQRRQLHLKTIKTTTSHERREGPSYAHNIGLSLDVNQTSTNSQRETNSSILQILKKVNLTTCKLQLPNYEDLIPSSEVRPALTEILFDPQKTYRGLLSSILKQLLLQELLNFFNCLQ